MTDLEFEIKLTEDDITQLITENIALKTVLDLQKEKIEELTQRNSDLQSENNQVKLSFDKVWMEYSALNELYEELKIAYQENIRVYNEFVSEHKAQLVKIEGKVDIVAGIHKELHETIEETKEKELKRKENAATARHGKDWEAKQLYIKDWRNINVERQKLGKRLITKDEYVRNPNNNKYGYSEGTARKWLKGVE